MQNFAADSAGALAGFAPNLAGSRSQNALDAAFASSVGTPVQNSPPITPTIRRVRPRVDMGPVVSLAVANRNFQYPYSMQARENVTDPLVLGWRCPQCSAQWHFFMVNESRRNQRLQWDAYVPLEIAVHFGEQHAPLGSNQIGLCNCGVRWVVQSHLDAPPL